MNLIKLIIPPGFFYLVRYIKRRLKREYTIQDFSLKLSRGHLLSEFQNHHRLYDRFLPYLSKYIESNETIVDVGANIGDTAYQIAAESDSKVICIEGSEKFYEYLKANIENLRAGKRNNITCIQALVSQEKSKGSLQHINGTASFVKDENLVSNVINKTLDVLLKDESNIRLIKVDTDGYDHDVLLSGEGTIKKHQPLLFWENVVENDQQLAGYDSLYQKLEDLGYSRLYIFDNLGNFLLSSTDFESLYSICQYVYTIKQHGDHKTFSYTDTLAVTEKDEKWVDAIIQNYKKDIIKTKGLR